MSERNIIESLKWSLKKYGHLYSLFVVLAFTIVTRLQGINNLRDESGDIILSGNDPWYHFRATVFQVENYPYFLNFDPMSGYPEGAAAGTFGTLFDFINASISLIIGLGNPSEELIKEVLIFTGPVYGAISVALVYIIGKYVTGSEWAGVGSAVILSLIPGTFYRRTQVGFADHQSLEILMLLVTVIGIVKFIDYSEENNIILRLINDYTNVTTKEWSRYLGLSALLMFLYYMVWPPAIMVFGLITITAVLYVLIGYSKESLVTESALLSMTVLSFLNLIMVLIRQPTMDPQIAKPSIIHIGVAVIALFVCGVSYALNKKGNEMNWSNQKFYGAFTLAIVVPGFLALGINPSVIDSITDQILRVLGFPFGLGAGSEQIQTIGEEGGASILGLTVTQYGFMLYSAVGGILYTAYKIYNDMNKNNQFGSKLFLLVFGSFILIISVRTIRFNYYLAPVVAIFGIILIHKLIGFVGLPNTLSELQGYHILSLLIILFLFTPVLLMPINVGTVYQQEASMNQGYQDWEEPLEWLDNNSDEVGIDQYGVYEKNSFEYPEESYGIMSWWDYGHWITATAERPAVANPFQQHAYNASDYLLANSTEKSENVMKNLDENAEAKYIAIDWQMVSPYSKYAAITQFNNNVTLDDTITRYYETQPGAGAEISFIQKDQRYYESTMVRLYYGHGGRMDPSSYTVDYNLQGTQVDRSIRVVTPELDPIKKHDTIKEARNYAENNTEVSVGGIGNKPKDPVKALDNYRLVKTSDSLSVRKGSVAREFRSLNSSSNNSMGIRDYDPVPSTVKLFEKVEGANIRINNLRPNSRISVGVPVQDPSTNQTFVYSRIESVNENGTSTFTVPYSTGGYDSVDNPPEVKGIRNYRVSYVNKAGTILEYSVPEKSVSEGETINLTE